MRFWSLHPRYLDTKRLTAAWREGLLCLKALDSRIETYGYRNHPQVTRWGPPGPYAQQYVAAYLACIHEEANFVRGYNFNWDLVPEKMIQDHVINPSTPPVILCYVSKAQIEWEMRHLAKKIYRSTNSRAALQHLDPTDPDPHPLIRVLPTTQMEPWERGHL